MTLKRSGKWNEVNDSDICGCFTPLDSTLKYLPRVKLHVHATILDTVSQTTLTQTFTNPTSQPLEGIGYHFPLYDGATVNGFNCTVGDRRIYGVVEEHQKAKTRFSEAISKGKTAGLLEQSLKSADVFKTRIGNIPAGENVKIEITYLNELKHDAEIDGISFMIPTIIAPRYGAATCLEKDQTEIQQDGLDITIDVSMPSQSAIKSIQSPSHPISVSLNTTAPTPKNHFLDTATVKLYQQSTSLDKEFVLQILAAKVGQPAAFLETHPTIPNQQALMTTLVPRFELPVEKPEIVFICDRSGSMHGKIESLTAALLIFLKSLPIGVKFNICSFGDRFSFLWPQSVTYGQETLDEAISHIGKFRANYGGTEIYKPMEATFNQRDKKLNLEAFLLTDGEIWASSALFQLVNEEVKKSNNAIRVFSVGVGHNASTALVEGVARAGNGFAQLIRNGERMDKKIIRMLKGALLPHVDAYHLEIKYGKGENEDIGDEDFEIIEKTMDSLSDISLDENDIAQTRCESVSLFDPSSCGDDEGIGEVEAIEQKDDRPPSIACPRYLQTPTEIPQLYSFSRTNLYVLISNPDMTKTPTSVLLKGRHNGGTLEIEIPIIHLATKSTVIHQLAARNEVRELEEGRGWLSKAKFDSGMLIKELFNNNFADIVQKEAVRLGLLFQVAGKWCSFIAIEEAADKGHEEVQVLSNPTEPCTSTSTLIDVVEAPNGGNKSGHEGNHVNARKFFVNNSSDDDDSESDEDEDDSGGANKFLRSCDPDSDESEDEVRALVTARRIKFFRGASSDEEESDSDADEEASVGTNKFLQCCNSDKVRAGVSRFLREASSSDEEPGTLAQNDLSSGLQSIVFLQGFAGNWVWSASLEKLLNISADTALKLSFPDTVVGHESKDSIIATTCAILYIKKTFRENEESWEILVFKAEAWLENQVGGCVKELETLCKGLF